MNPSRLTGVTPRLPVAELGRTIAFYTRRLGFELSVVWPEAHPTFAILERDAVSLGFFTPDALRGHVTIGTADLYLGTDDVRALHAALQGEVVIVGARDHAEIWAPARWDDVRRSLEDPETLAAHLDGLGI